MDSGTPAFQDFSLVLIWWGGLFLLVLGLAKFALYAIGATRPDWFARLQSETLRRFLAGRGHRFIFGWGGFITAALGAFFMLAAKGMALLMERLRF